MALGLRTARGHKNLLDERLALIVQYRNCLENVGGRLATIEACDDSLEATAFLQGGNQ